MSTPKINFFIQAGHRGIFTGPCPGPSGKQTIVRVSSPGSARARDSAGQQEEVRGRSGETPRCAQRVMTPNPNNCAQSRRSRSCNPESRWYNNPNNSSTYPRSPSWRPRSPIPNPEYPEYFPLGGRMPDPAKRSSYSAGLSLSSATGICSASMGISAGVTSFMRFLARSINSCSCSTI